MRVRGGTGGFVPRRAVLSLIRKTIPGRTVIFSVAACFLLFFTAYRNDYRAAMKRIFISLALVCAAGARADLVTQQQIVTPNYNGVAAIKIKGTKIRMDMYAGQPQALSTITDLNTGEIINLLHSQKLYLKLPGQPMKQAKSSSTASRAPVPRPTGIHDVNVARHRLLLAILTGHFLSQLENPRMDVRRRAAHRSSDDTEAPAVGHHTCNQAGQRAAGAGGDDNRRRRLAELPAELPVELSVELSGEFVDCEPIAHAAGSVRATSRHDVRTQPTRSGLRRHYRQHGVDRASFTDAGPANFCSPYARRGQVGVQPGRRSRAGDDDGAGQTRVRRGRGGGLDEVRRRGPTGDDHIGTLEGGFGDEELELSRLVAGDREPGEVVALDEQRPCQRERLREPWRRHQRRRQDGQRCACNGGGGQSGSYGHVGPSCSRAARDRATTRSTIAAAAPESGARQAASASLSSPLSRSSVAIDNSPFVRPAKAS